MKKERNWGRAMCWLVFLTLLGGLALAAMAKINQKTPVCEAKEGVLLFSTSQLKEGPFLLVGEWERYDGLYTPQQLESQTLDRYQDIRLPEELSGATYRAILYSECLDEIYFMPSRSDLRVWLNGTSVQSSSGTQSLKTSDLYRIADYVEGTKVEIVFQAGVSEEIGAYVLMIAGGYQQVGALRNLRLILDSMRIGLYLALLACCLTLFWGKRSEHYLLFLAGILLQQLFSWRSVLGYIMSDAAADRLDYMVGAVYLLVNVFPYLIYRQMDSFEIPKWCDRIALGTVILSEAVYLMFRLSYYSVGNVMAFVYYGLAFYLIGRALLRGVRGAGILALGQWSVVVFTLFSFLRNRGWIAHGTIDVPLFMTQYNYLGLTLACSVGTLLKFAEGYRQAECLAAEFDRKVKEQTEELRNSNASILRMQAQNHELMAGLVHNIRSPLFVLGGYFDLLADDLVQPTQEQKHYIALISGKIEALNRMVQDMFLLVQLEDGQIHFEMIHLRASELLDALVRDNQPKAEEKQIVLRVVCEPDFVFTADGFRLQQALDNILNNAIRHSSAGQEIQLGGTQQADGTVCLWVEDHGCGIHAEQMPRLFERYISKGDGGSTGLGLSISKFIVEGHHGTIQVESELDRGTRVIVQLPPQD